jgi:replicative DNA helicase
MTNQSLQFMNQLLPNLPEAVEIEKLILGVLLDDPEAAAAILTLERDDFYLEQHKRILDAGRWCDDNGQEISLLSVSQRLTDTRHLESVGGLTYLSGISTVPKVVDLETYLGTLRIKSTLRRAAIMHAKYAEECCMPGAGPEVLASAEAALRELGTRTRIRPGSRGLEAFLDAEYGGSYAQFLAPEKGVSVPTPWENLNKLLTGGGFMPGQLVVIGALPGLGKSAAAAMIARFAGEQGVIVFSLEMSEREIWLRMIASHAKVPLKPLSEGVTFEDEDARHRIAAAGSALSKMALRIDDWSGSTVQAIVAEVKRVKPMPKLVIVDYLQLLYPLRKRSNRVEEIGEISRALKLAASELKLPFVVLSQLNRETARNKREPELHDLRESGSIEQDANTVMFLHASQDELREAIAHRRANEIELIIRKQRNGATGKVKLVFTPSTMRIVEGIEEGEI